MNDIQNTCLIDEILLELGEGRQSMRRQIGIISDVMEKSNNILLQIEATRPPKPNPSTHNTDAYIYSKEALYALASIVESFCKIAENGSCVRAKGEPAREVGDASNREHSLLDFEAFLMKNRQKAEYLNGIVRKLLAINDTVAQMKTNLQQISETCNEDLSSE